MLIVKNTVDLKKQAYSNTLETPEEEEQEKSTEKKLGEEDDLFSNSAFYFNSHLNSTSIRWIEHQSKLCSNIISKNTPPPKFYI